MIKNIMKISLINLRRDKVAFSMTFILPVIFFSIFAMIFGATGRTTRDSKIKVVITDVDQTEMSHRFSETVRKQQGLDAADAPDPATAHKQVHDGRYAAAVIIRKGFGDNFGNFQSTTEPVELVYDEANPIAQFAVAGLLQASAMMTAPDLLMERGFSQLEVFGGGLTPQQRSAIEQARPYIRGTAGNTSNNSNSVPDAADTDDE